MAELDEAGLLACKQYMKAEDLDDPVIESMYQAALEHMHTLGIVETDANRFRFRLCVHALAADWYDHRSNVGTEDGLPVGVRHVLNFLKNVPESGTEVTDDDEG